MPECIISHITHELRKVGYATKDQTLCSLGAGVSVHNRDPDPTAAEFQICYTGLGQKVRGLWSGPVKFYTAPPLLVRLKYVVALGLAQSTVFVSLKNIKMVTVGGLGRPVFGWSGAAGGVEVVSCHMRQLSTV